ncbi:MCE family protein [Mycolicibacterium elephantis]|uniref:MCE family protein n=1 Tax=Mycolicibacterium elephantis TaxID=81858 RepID=UPI000FE23579|nr:MCE family protein [Mycolicibacterium elephantis]MCV7222083.1 MCE family protein [Mycolicibacterium elephantis]
MRDNLTGALWRLGIFVMVCVLAVFVTLMVFAQLRFQKEAVYRAEFTNVSMLESGDFVRIAGVEVGKVKSVTIGRDAVATVEFSADDSVLLTQGTRAAIRYANLIGDRYLELLEGAGSAERLGPGDTIPVERTAPALDLDSLIGGFRPLFRALDPEQVNLLSDQLIRAFQDQGATIGSFLNQAAAFTNTLADRDQLIGQVIANLSTVLASLGDESEQLDKAVSSLSELMTGLEARKGVLAEGLAQISTNTGVLAPFLQEVRAPLPKAVQQTDRVTTLVVSDHEYVDNLLATLPDAYRALGRPGLYGDFFSYYICDLVLKLNGKGGNPVYVKIVGQSSGRCTPK